MVLARGMCLLFLPNEKWEKMNHVNLYIEQGEN